MSYDRGRHDRHTQQHQGARYHLRRGMATVALQAKVDGRAPVDCVGTPLQYATEMMERHSVQTLSKWSRGATTTAVAGGMAFCARCERVPEACRCRRRRR